MYGHVAFFCAGLPELPRISRLGLEVRSTEETGTRVHHVFVGACLVLPSSGGFQEQEQESLRDILLMGLGLILTFARKVWPSFEASPGPLCPGQMSGLADG